MARTSKIDWEAYKDQLITLKEEGKSLTAINAVLHERLGISFTNARLSQKFKEWRGERNIAEEVIQGLEEIKEGLST